MVPIIAHMAPNLQPKNIYLIENEEKKNII